MYTSFERSVNAKKQLRDKYGKWIFMGGRAKWFDSLANLFRSGKVIDISPTDVTIRETSTGKSYKVPRGSVEAITAKASLGNQAKPQPGAVPNVTEHSAGVYVISHNGSAKTTINGPDLKSGDRVYGFVGTDGTSHSPAGTHNDSVTDGTVWTYQGNDTWKSDTGLSEVSPFNPASGPKYVKESDAIDDKIATLNDSVKADLNDEAEPTNIDGWKKIKALGGSTGAALYEDENGSQFVVKFPEEEKAKNEVLANRLYSLVGVQTPDTELISQKGKIGIASPFLPNKGEIADHMGDKAVVDAVKPGFVPDAWLANWDFAGLTNDNIVILPDGTPIRVDNGGALIYRAQGAPKGNAFGNTVGELETLRTSPQGRQFYGPMTDDEIAQSAAPVVNVTDQQIDDLVDSVDFKPVVAASVKARLKARRDDIAAKIPASKGVKEELDAVLEKQAPTPYTGVPGEAGPEVIHSGPGVTDPNTGLQSLFAKISAENAKPKPVDINEMPPGSILTSSPNGVAGTGHWVKNQDESFTYYNTVGQPVGEAKFADQLVGKFYLSGNVNDTDLPKTTGSGKFKILEDTGANGDGYHSSGPWGKYGAAGVLIQSPDESGQPMYLLVQRGKGVSSNKGKWQLPGGAMNSKEDAYQGTARETHEELGTSQQYLDTLQPVGEVVYDNGKGWQYTNITANAPEQFDPVVDGSETGDAKWLYKAEIEDMTAKGELHPSLAGKIDELFATYNPNTPDTQVIHDPDVEAPDEEEIANLDVPSELPTAEELSTGTKVTTGTDANYYWQKTDEHTWTNESGGWATNSQMNQVIANFPNVEISDPEEQSAEPRPSAPDSSDPYAPGTQVPDSVEPEFYEGAPVGSVIHETWPQGNSWWYIKTGDDDWEGWNSQSGEAAGNFSNLGLSDYNDSDATHTFESQDSYPGDLPDEIQPDTSDNEPLADWEKELLYGPQFQPGKVFGKTDEATIAKAPVGTVIKEEYPGEDDDSASFYKKIADDTWDVFNEKTPNAKSFTITDEEVAGETSDNNHVVHTVVPDSEWSAAGATVPAQQTTPYAPGRLPKNLSVNWFNDAPEGTVVHETTTLPDDDSEYFFKKNANGGWTIWSVEKDGITNPNYLSAGMASSSKQKIFDHSIVDPSEWPGNTDTATSEPTAQTPAVLPDQPTAADFDSLPSGTKIQFGEDPDKFYTSNGDGTYTTDAFPDGSLMHTITADTAESIATITGKKPAVSAPDEYSAEPNYSVGVSVNGQDVEYYRNAPVGTVIHENNPISGADFYYKKTGDNTWSAFNVKLDQGIGTFSSEFVHDEGVSGVQKHTIADPSTYPPDAAHPIGASYTPGTVLDNEGLTWYNKAPNGTTIKETWADGSDSEFLYHKNDDGTWSYLSNQGTIPINYSVGLIVADGQSQDSTHTVVNESEWTSQKSASAPQSSGDNYASGDSAKGKDADYFELAPAGTVIHGEFVTYVKNDDPDFWTLYDVSSTTPLDSNYSNDDMAVDSGAAEFPMSVGAPEDAPNAAQPAPASDGGNGTQPGDKVYGAVENYANLPVGTRLSGDPNSGSLYWEKTAPNEWTWTGSGIASKKTDAELSLNAQTPTGSFYIQKPDVAPVQTPQTPTPDTYGHTDADGTGVGIGDIVHGGKDEFGKIEAFPVGGLSVKVTTPDGQTKFWKLNKVTKQVNAELPEASKKYAVLKDDNGNEYVNDVYGNPVYVGDTVVSSGKTGFTGEVTALKPGGTVVLVKDPVDGKVKPRNVNKITKVSGKEAPTTPDVSTNEFQYNEQVTPEEDVFANLPVGTTVHSNPEATYLFTKEDDGLWYGHESGTPVNKNISGWSSGSMADPAEPMYYVDGPATDESPEASTPSYLNGDSVPATAESFDALPAGTVVHYVDDDGMTMDYEKDNFGTWESEAGSSYTAAEMADPSMPMIYGPAAAVEPVEDPEYTWEQGDEIASDIPEIFTSFPEGTVVHRTLASGVPGEFTKDDGYWYNPTSDTSYSDEDMAYLFEDFKYGPDTTLDEDNTSTPTQHPSGYAQSFEEIQAMPAGSVITYNPEGEYPYPATYTKNPDGTWKNAEGTVLPEENFKLGGESKSFQYGDTTGTSSAPTPEETPAALGPKIGDTPSSPAELDAMPVGTVLGYDSQYSSKGHIVYTKQADGEWIENADGYTFTSKSFFNAGGKASTKYEIIPTESTPATPTPQPAGPTATGKNGKGYTVGDTVVHPVKGQTGVVTNILPQPPSKTGGDASIVTIQTPDGKKFKYQARFLNLEKAAENQTPEPNKIVGPTPQNIDDAPIGSSLHFPNVFNTWVKNSDGMWQSTTSGEVKTDNPSSYWILVNAELTAPSTPYVPKPTPIGPVTNIQQVIDAPIGTKMTNKYGSTYTKTGPGEWAFDSGSNTGTVPEDQFEGPPINNGGYKFDGFDSTVAPAAPAAPKASTPTPQKKKTQAKPVEVLAKNPNSPWYEKPEPAEPTKPAGLKEDYATPELLAEISKAYQESKGKDFTKSSYYTYFENLSKNGSGDLPPSSTINEAKYGPQKDIFDFFQSRGYLTPESAAAGRAHLAKLNADNKVLLDTYGGQTKQYKQDLEDWKIANGIPLNSFNTHSFKLSSGADWIDSHGHTNSTGPAWGNANLVGTDVLTPDEIGAVQTWTSVGGNNGHKLPVSWSTFSADLRSKGQAGHDNPDVLANSNHRLLAERLDSAIEKSEIPEDIVWVRNGSSQNFSLPNGTKMTKNDVINSVGSILTDWGIVAGSLGESPGMGGGDILLKVRIPKGAHGLWLAGKNSGGKNGLGSSSEREMILPRGSRLYVHKVDSGSGYYSKTTVYADLVPDGWEPNQVEEAITPGATAPGGSAPSF